MTGQTFSDLLDRYAFLSFENGKRYECGINEDVLDVAAARSRLLELFEEQDREIKARGEVYGRMTDSKRLAWLVEREAYVSEGCIVPRWTVYSSQACLEPLGAGQTPRMAIDNAMKAEGVA